MSSINNVDCARQCQRISIRNWRTACAVVPLRPRRRSSTAPLTPTNRCTPCRCLSHSRVSPVRPVVASRRLCRRERLRLQRWTVCARSARAHTIHDSVVSNSKWTTTRMKHPCSCRRASSTWRQLATSIARIINCIVQLTTASPVKWAKMVWIGLRACARTHTPCSQRQLRQPSTVRLSSRWRRPHHAVVKHWPTHRHVQSTCRSSSSRRSTARLPVSSGAWRARTLHRLQHHHASDLRDAHYARLHLRSTHWYQMRERRILDDHRRVTVNTCVHTAQILFYHRLNFSLSRSIPRLLAEYSTPGHRRRLRRRSYSTGHIEQRQTNRRCIEMISVCIHFCLLPIPVWYNIFCTRPSIFVFCVSSHSLFVPCFWPTHIYPIHIQKFCGKFNEFDLYELYWIWFFLNGQHPARCQGITGSNEWQFTYTHFWVFILIWSNLICIDQRVLAYSRKTRIKLLVLPLKGYRGLGS